MKNILIDNNESLMKAFDYLHDTGFKIEEITYNPIDKNFKIKTKEYKYRGKFIQRKTNIIKREYELILCNVGEYNISKKDSKGYDATGEDYINYAISKDNESIVVKTTFHEIRLKINKIEGDLKETMPFHHARPAGHTK